MSLTGLNLRTRARRRVVGWLDRAIAWLDPKPEAQAVEAPAPPPAEPPPAEPPPAAAPAPLPDLPKALKPPPKPAEPKGKPAHNGARAAAPAAESAPSRETSDDRQQRHWARTRAGVLRFVHEQGGKATLRDMHEYSERTFFVAHVGFSRLMEELTDEGLLDYDHDSAVAALTDAGVAELG